MKALLPVLTTAFLARTGQLGLFSAETLILLDRGVPKDRIGLVMTAAAVGGALAQLAAGRWGHRCRSPRTTLLGTVLQTAGCLAFTAFTAWWSLAAADFLLMAGAALTSTGVRATLASDPPTGADTGPERLERAYGRLTAAQMLGALAGPLGAGAALLYGGTGAAWFASAATVAALAVAAAAARRPGVVVPPAAGARPRPALPSAGPAAVVLLGRLWPALVLLLGITALYGGYSVVWAVYLRGLGARDSLIAWSAACLALPALLLSPRAGSVLPRVPRTRLIRCAALLFGGTACLYPLLHTTAAAVALSLAEGVLLAIALPLISAKVARDAGPVHTTRAFGLLGAADALGSGLGTAVGGALLALGGAASAFRFSGALCLLCVLASLVHLPSTLPPSPSENGRSRHVSQSSPRVRAVRR